MAAEIRYRVTVEGTETAGDYTAPDPRVDSGLRTIASLQEGAGRNIRMVSAATLDLTSADLRDGVGDVRFIAVRPTGVCEISRAGTAGEVWRIAANGWFLVELAAGQVTTFRLVNQAGVTISVRLVIAGGE